MLTVLQVKSYKLELQFEEFDPHDLEKSNADSLASPVLPKISQVSALPTFWCIYTFKI